MDDLLRLEVHGLDVPVLTGVYSEETHLPQPLRISITADLDCPRHFAADAPLSTSKSYIDLKHAATAALPPGVHFTLIEAVADHICEDAVPAGRESASRRDQDRQAGDRGGGRIDRHDAGAPPALT